MIYLTLFLAFCVIIPQASDQYPWLEVSQNVFNALIEMVRQLFRALRKLGRCCKYTMGSRSLSDDLYDLKLYEWNHKGEITRTITPNNARAVGKRSVKVDWVQKFKRVILIIHDQGERCSTSQISRLARAVKKNMKNVLVLCLEWNKKVSVWF